MKKFNTQVQIDGFQIPSLRSYVANERKVQNNFLFRAWGGIGDVLCAEPAIRYALKKFKGVEFSLATDHPALFSHLKFKDVFGLKDPNLDDYLIFDTMATPQNLVWEYASHMLTNCVDFASLCALSRQLPVSEKEVFCEGVCPDHFASGLLAHPKAVFIHAGKHWPTKTFPKTWWDEILTLLRGHGCLPVLIGSDVDANRGTVDVNVEHVVDLRNELTVRQTIYLLQRAKVLLTNDSAPLHFAASRDPQNLEYTGDTYIGFFATCKHPDFISHWRKGGWAYRMENLATSGTWETLNDCPNQMDEINADKITGDVRDFLPEPRFVADWVVNKFERKN